MQKDKYQVLKEWNDLLQIGAITEAEFLAKKSELLGDETQANNSPKASQSITPEQKKLIMIGGGIVALFLVIFLVIKLIPKSENSTQNMTSNSTEASKTEDTQVTQEEQKTNQKYASYNFYGNNVTEYLETDASGNVFYSTSTRPNPIKMLITKVDNSGELILVFPDDTGDNQRYRMRKINNELVISVPNSKEQVYTLKTDEVAEINTKDNSKWVGNYESLFDTASGPSNMTITIGTNNKAVCKYSSRSGATNINATLSVLGDDKASLIFEDGSSDGYGDIQIDKDLKQGGLVAELQKDNVGFSTSGGIVRNRTFKKVAKYTE